MHTALIQPPVIAMSLWLNAHRAGEISQTDAANACEVISQALNLQSGSTSTSWAAVVSQAAASASPCVAVIPTFGDPAGVPAKIMPSIATTRGVIGIGPDFLLYQDNSSTWQLHEVPHTITPPDQPYLRRQFLEGLERAVRTLGAADFMGDRNTIDDMLKDSAFAVMPPGTSERVLTQLDQATRVRIVAQVAMTESLAPASRSTDNLRLATLQEIDRLAIDLISALASQ